uniref:cytochrome b-245 chaperone 1 homolog isoform X1 n=1 Tax=Oncorhynchus gorbuscha TaxID=8017 RepID=UPI001EAF30A5|nr:cytochrome b-245 chaperone 1 homolog isoform X1 [Oncorhynchus gorbuscha]XP_046212865.1 cytochrome b-245 chaperone 1 homolog isoform X1 [Oncorhynchus gorbuscha]
MSFTIGIQLAQGSSNGVSPCLHPSIAPFHLPHIPSLSCCRPSVTCPIPFLSSGLGLSVVMDMRHLRDVCVQEEKVRYLGKGYLLVLRLATGFSYPLTQSTTMGGHSDVEAVASLLKRFLGLEELQRHWEQEEEAVREEDELNRSTDSGEEGDSVQ